MLISVIIPVYNAERYLRRCIDSVLSQTYTCWEIVAVDDGSKDESYRILMDYATAYTNIHIASQENHGPGHTRNKAMHMASGDFFVFLDADDYLECGYFSILVSTVEEEKADVVFVDLIQEKPDGEFIKYEKMSRFSALNKDRLIRVQMTGKMPWGGCRKAVKAALIKDNSIEYSGNIVGEEAIYSFRVLHLAEKISFVSENLYHYVNYPNSQSKKGKDDPLGPVVSSMSAYLNEQGLLGEYIDTINSFACTAFAVTVFRVSQNYSYIKARKQIREYSIHYCKEMKGNVDKEALEIRVRAFSCLMKFHLYSILILASRAKGWMQRLRI